MVRSKASAKKQQQKKGVDFKKIKRKLGRKLPPPKNATNTEIKSRAIILPEQSVAAEKSGLALSKKGLTLKELLQHTSHHNAKVRKDALVGIKDLFQNHPAELRLHKYAVIEKLRERVCDDDKLVRETLYQLFKSVIFPGCKEDNQGPFVSLLMAYIFNAMTHLAIEVRLMAFKFFDLVVQHYPPTFSLYAEKILQNYKDILQKNQFYIQDKGKLKVALSGLERCLSLLPCDKSESCSSDKSSCEDDILHAYKPDTAKECAGFAHLFMKLRDLVSVLINCFQDFIPLVHSMPVLDAQSFDCIHYILQSIDHAIKFSINGNHQGQSLLVPTSEGPDMTIWDQAMSSLLLKKLLGVFPLNPVHHLSDRDDDRYFILNISITEIFLQFNEWIYPPADLCDKFLEFIDNALLGKNSKSTRSGKAIQEKSLLSLLPFIPKLVSRVDHKWRYRLLQAFTYTFKDCKPESPLKLACVSIIEEMIIPREDMLYLDASDPEIFSYQITWIRELPSILLELGDKHPLSSQAVLRLLLRLGQHRFLNASHMFEDEIQYALCSFYRTYQEEGNVSYGPFVTLPKDSQELSICCLYYFSNFSSHLLRSIASCCLCSNLEPCVLYRIIEVLHSAYKAGHIQIADHISFFITLISRFNVLPGRSKIYNVDQFLVDDRLMSLYSSICAEKIFPMTECDVETTNRGTFKVLSRIVCSYLSEMGDSTLVFQILAKVILEQISLKPPLDNTCAMLRMLCVVDSKPTRLSEADVVNLCNFMVGYLVDVIHSIPQDDAKTSSNYIHLLRYYFTPCFLLLDRSCKLVDLVFSILGSLIGGSVSALSSHQHRATAGDSLNTINTVVSIILSLNKDGKARKIISSFKLEIECILQSILSLQSSDTITLTIEEKHIIQCAHNRLKIVSSTLPNSDPAV